METLLLKGIITATSDKQSDKFVTASPQKSVYIELDADNTQKAKAFGLREYTSQEDGNAFFIIKTSRKVDLYQDKVKVDTISGVAGEYENFHSDGKEVGLSLIKGESKQGNEYYRLHAINGEMVRVESINPFQ